MILLVCGFARSGSSMVMQMLAAGGYPVTGSHPMYELSSVTEDPSGDWIENCHGMAVKILSPIKHPPKMGPDYRIILLGRDLKEQAKSWVKWRLADSGEQVHRAQRQASVKAAMAHIHNERAPAAAKCRELSDGHVVSMRFEDILDDPHGTAMQLLAMVHPFELDVDAAAAVVRQRSPKCFDGLLEKSL